MALFDAGSGRDPLIRRINESRPVIVGHDPVRDVSAKAEYRCHRTISSRAGWSVDASRSPPRNPGTDVQRLKDVECPLTRQPGGLEHRRRRCRILGDRAKGRTSTGITSIGAGGSGLPWRSRFQFRERSRSATTPVRHGSPAAVEHLELGCRALSSERPHVRRRAPHFHRVPPGWRGRTAFASPRCEPVFRPYAIDAGSSRRRQECNVWTPPGWKSSRGGLARPTSQTIPWRPLAARRNIAR